VAAIAAGLYVAMPSRFARARRALTGAMGG
jgi:hypothetical protein